MDSFNKEIKNAIKILKTLEDPGVLTEGTLKTIKGKITEHRGYFLLRYYIYKVQVFLEIFGLIRV